MALPANNEFDLARKRAQQTENANLQQQKDAIARRSAQLGGGVSGAMMKQESMAQDQSAKRLADVNEGIDTAQRVEDRRVREIQEGRDFQKSERLGSQDFASTEALRGRDFSAAEAAKQRGFLTSERLGGQDFTSGEAAKQRGFITSERLGSQEYATGERISGQEFASKERRSAQQHQARLASAAQKLQDSQFRKQLDLATSQFEWEKYIDQKNLGLADKMSKDGGILDGVFNNNGDGSGGYFNPSNW